MKSAPLRIGTLITSLLILTLHELAVWNGWYSPTTDFDIVMHILGGFWVGTFLLYFFEEHPRLSPLHETGGWRAFVSLVSLVVLVGVLWEFYEFLAAYLPVILRNASTPEFQTYTDTLGDLLCDITGSIAAGLAFIRFQKKQPLR
jgi:hypothetical protein